MRDAEMMTLTEFHYKRYAQDYKEVDELYNMHLSAFLNRNASATENKGTEKKPREEYVFKDFKDFFDYEKALREVSEGFTRQEEKKPESKSLSPAELAAKRNRKG
ncbi:hypothetical protein GCM10007063_05530 [Lentibacillus kapialis]|uniref:Uncharacterized protein n=1 Tax=Lentibacillus kapialis TaxID=340214 RepID=A0A917PNH3_9BACI|nr:hypothetical protein [Lentibacillus kapialis]GGJ85952.1 hypothetical protein GCM10007063_05530 [Lentibacillus kapialis]